jgi:hypothetical protein
MNHPAAEPASSSAPNLGELLESTLHNAKTLLQAELSLAKRELSSELTSMLSSVGLLIAGAFFLQAALTTLGVLLVMAFGIGIAAVAVVVVLAGIGAALLVVALRALERKKLPRTTARLALDTQQVMETVK